MHSKETHAGDNKLVTGVIDFIAGSLGERLYFYTRLYSYTLDNRKHLKY